MNADLKPSKLFHWMFPKSYRSTLKNIPIKEMISGKPLKITKPSNGRQATTRAKICSFFHFFFRPCTVSGVVRLRIMCYLPLMRSLMPFRPVSAAFCF